MDPELKGWLAFAEQKLQEVAILACALNEGEAAIAAHLRASVEANASRRASARVHRDEVAVRTAGFTDEITRRRSAYKQRPGATGPTAPPPFPTTTIGSFPQTADIRRARAALTRQEMTETAYDSLIAGWIDNAVRQQEEIGLDVLVHGEFERND